MMEVMDESLPAPMVWPTVRARDARALIAFLTEALGFEEVVVHANGDLVEHAELAWPQGGGVMLGSERTGDGSGTGAPGSLSVYVACDDPDALCARAVAAGAVLERDLYDTDYGSRDFQIRDPEGNHWSFGTYRGHRHGTP